MTEPGGDPLVSSLQEDAMEEEKEKTPVLADSSLQMAKEAMDAEVRDRAQAKKEKEKLMATKKAAKMKPEVDEGGLILAVDTAFRAGDVEGCLAALQAAFGLVKFNDMRKQISKNPNQSPGAGHICVKRRSSGLSSFLSCGGSHLAAVST